MLLSIAMIVKNEQKNLERCLKALKSLDHKIEYEIIVVDTGSTDATVSIAKKYTDKVFEHEWNNNFAEMRNISIKYCKGKWILILDADEVLESEYELVEFLKCDISKVVNSATVQLKNYVSDNEDEYLIGSLARIFRNDENFFYTGRIHEQPNVASPTAATNITLKHYGYSRADYNLMEYKYKRNKELLLKDLNEGKNLIYTYFQLAQTYAMANKMDESFVSIKKSFELAKNEHNQKKYLYIYHFYARELLQRQDYVRGIEICKKALKYSNEHLDFYYMILKSYLGINNYKEAKVFIEKYLSLHNTIENGYIVKDISVNNFSFCRKEDVLKDKILCHYKEEEYSKIPELFKKLNKNSSKEQYSEVYIYSLMKNKMKNELVEFLKEKKLRDEDIQKITNVLERIRDDSLDGDINEEIIWIYNLDNRLDRYIDCVLLKKSSIKYSDEVELNIFYNWKGEYIRNLFIAEEVKFSILKDLNKEDILSYLNFISSDYKCLQLLSDYSKNNYMINDIKILNLINNIEEVLILNSSIEEKEYDKLVNRAFVNKINYIRQIYSNKILSNSYLYNLLNKYEKVWMDIMEAIKFCNNDKLLYINRLKKVLKYYPEYNRLIKLYLSNISKDVISEEMINEKNHILSTVQSFINNNRVDEAILILEEIKNIFKFDAEILNYLGVAQYIKGQYDESINNLSLSDVLEENKFETNYNMACVFECKGNLELSKYYYEKACDLCEDNQLQQQIRAIIKEFN